MCDVVNDLDLVNGRRRIRNRKYHSHFFHLGLKENTARHTKYRSTKHHVALHTHFITYRSPLTGSSSHIILLTIGDNRYDVVWHQPSMGEYSNRYRPSTSHQPVCSLINDDSAMHSNFATSSSKISSIALFAPLHKPSFASAIFRH